MSNCPTCGRRPSERHGAAFTVPSVEVGEKLLSVVHRYLPGGSCDDPIHDLADAGPELVERLKSLLEAAQGAADLEGSWLGMRVDIFETKSLLSRLEAKR